MNPALGLAWLAHETGRDLQHGVRSAGGVRALWEGGAAVLGRALRLSSAEAADVHRAIRAVQPDQLQSEVAKRGQRFIARDDAAYPVGLRDLFDPPFGLFVADDAPQAFDAISGRPLIAIVGARRASAEGMSFAEGLASALVGRGATVVSGMARGIDTAAHRGAIAAGGHTIAILGCGVDVAYPASNRALHGLIATHGMVASEYWPGTRPAPWRFPARNRIVAGLCDCVVVVEAGDRSGALITADFALELGRPVLAVPGRPRSTLVAGCHALIRSGAALCEAVDDVIAEVPHLGWKDALPVVDVETEFGAAILEGLADGPRSRDELAGELGAPAGDVGASLAEFEIAGLVRLTGGRAYLIAARGGPR